jgi:pyruvate,orthophosphate dikinase
MELGRGIFYTLFQYKMKKRRKTMAETKKAAETKFVYHFAEGDAGMKNLLGGKGANLAEMINIGIPVPDGFVVTTEACTDYYANKEKVNPKVTAQIKKALSELEAKTGKKLGDAKNPLLVSVRSGSRASMPGMMDTILNLGMNDAVCASMEKMTGNPRFARDCYRRFIQMFADVVMGVPKHDFERVLDKVREAKGVKNDSDLTAEDFTTVIEEFKAFFKKNKGFDFPQDTSTQLMAAIEAVFKSWNNSRAITYRRLNDIPGDWGTAVNIQMMVFGNLGDTSGTGVAFSRDPSTGENKIYGEYLMNAQGEDVVAGIRTPLKISELEKQNPAVYKQFVQIYTKLEKHYKDMQDMEFTIENGKLYFLQTRNGKRTAFAALKIAVDMVNEKLLNEKEALLKIDPKQLDALLHPQFIPAALQKAQAIAEGLPASPGAACGQVVFTAEAACQFAEKKAKTILVRLETCPDDIEGMVVAEGILTARGGMTSHAAVVARGMGTCCVAGCGELIIKEEEKYFMCGGKKYVEGDFISLDGSTGKIYGEQIPTQKAELSGDFKIVMDWADKYRKLGVRTNAETAEDLRTAIGFGAEGVGLCRTEHMFFGSDRIGPMREMIVSKTVEEREKALAKLLPFQRDDFYGIFKEMKGMPVTIRFLDPPLHEFVPHTDDEIKALAKEMGIEFEDLKNTIAGLHEFNPMLGHRGLRLSITYPEIAVMQTRAVIEAAIKAKKDTGVELIPEIMIPLTCEKKELDYIKRYVHETADAIIEASPVKIKYMVGTMIEIPRACILADKIAESAEFFSFGTNDLTQMTYGFSRDDAGKFLPDYYTKKIFDSDPFVRLDTEGAGFLLKMACDKGKATRKNIKLGICGEHGGDPSTIEFCHQVGLNYVSCSPFRVPIARLAAAQAALRNPK